VIAHSKRQTDYNYRYFKKMIKLFKTGMSDDCDEFPQMLEGKNP